MRVSSGSGGDAITRYCQAPVRTRGPRQRAELSVVMLCCALLRRCPILVVHHRMARLCCERDRCIDRYIYIYIYIYRCGRGLAAHIWRPFSACGEAAEAAAAAADDAAGAPTAWGGQLKQPQQPPGAGQLKQPQQPPGATDLPVCQTCFPQRSQLPQLEPRLPAAISAASAGTSSGLPCLWSRLLQLVGCPCLPRCYSDGYVDGPVDGSTAMGVQGVSRAVCGNEKRNPNPRVAHGLGRVAHGLGTCMAVTSAMAWKRRT